jgi:CBS domain-containing protein
MNRDVTVREVVHGEFVGVSESDALLETVELLLSEEADTALVLRGTDPVGLVTHRDVLRTLVDGPSPEDAVVEDVMESTVPTIEPDATIGEAADRVSTEHPGRLVVTNGDQPLGILTEHDLLRTRPTSVAAAREEPADAMTLATEPETSRGAAGGGGDRETFEEQSICEGCGTLTGDLVSFNGQLLCSDCRDL